ncbi:PREDICTED: uncharacterized protein LOC102022000 [Chinchilla lanigera]|uniref:uncharacterized protein LOC102022000 n=1 Tax=Chinchilla lanigera TaxID=34839 RepID=UPI00038EADF9|nr:PREDICTED: uncharacterized protein LOC102022000 [Chinchilla lanigera]
MGGFPIGSKEDVNSSRLRAEDAPIGQWEAPESLRASLIPRAPSLKRKKGESGSLTVPARGQGGRPVTWNLPEDLEPVGPQQRSGTAAATWSDRALTRSGPHRPVLGVIRLHAGEWAGSVSGHAETSFPAGVQEAGTLPPRGPATRLWAPPQGHRAGLWEALPVCSAHGTSEPAQPTGKASQGTGIRRVHAASCPHRQAGSPNLQVLCTPHAQRRKSRRLRAGGPAPPSSRQACWFCLVSCTPLIYRKRQRNTCRGQRVLCYLQACLVFTDGTEKSPDPALPTSWLFSSHSECCGCPKLALLSLPTCPRPLPPLHTVRRLWPLCRAASSPRQGGRVITQPRSRLARRCPLSDRAALCGGGD